MLLSLQTKMYESNVKGVSWKIIIWIDRGTNAQLFQTCLIFLQIDIQNIQSCFATGKKYLFSLFS